MIYIPSNFRENLIDLSVGLFNQMFCCACNQLYFSKPQPWFSWFVILRY